MVIAWVLLFCLSGISIAMLIWGFSKKERIYQYPTIAGAVWLLYIIPQAIGSLINPYKFPNKVIEDHGYEIALIMCIFCAISGWLGYRSNKWKRLKMFTPVILKQSSIFNLWILIYIISFYFAYKLASL